MMKKLLFILGICLLSAPGIHAEGESLKYQYTKAFIESLEWVKASEDKIDETDLDYTKYESDAKMAYQYIENLAKATDDLKKAMDKISSYIEASDEKIKNSAASIYSNYEKQIKIHDDLVKVVELLYDAKTLTYSEGYQYERLLNEFEAHLINKDNLLKQLIKETEMVADMIIKPGTKELREKFLVDDEERESLIQMILDIFGDHMRVGPRVGSTYTESCVAVLYDRLMFR